MRRVVVTGLGVVSPIGIGLDAYWSGLIAGRSGVGAISRFDASQYPTRIAAEIHDFDGSAYMDRKELRRNDRFVQFAYAATRMALEHARFSITPANATRTGVLIGSGIGGAATWEEQHRTLLERGADRVSPFFIPMMITNIATGVTAILTGARGPSSCVVTACATGGNAIGDAARIIEHGDADVMIAGGAEAAITALSVAGFCAMRAMSTRNDEAQTASRPFDATRDGFVMGEGAGILILESRAHAEARGATILAEMLGYGVTADAHHITQPDPDGDGAYRGMLAALADAEVEPEQVEYINAHGTSTPLNDAIETKAIKRVFGDHARRLAVSSTKSMTGHLMGAAGGVEAVTCVLAMQHGMIPPTINYKTPDPDCDLDYVPNTPRAGRVRVAMSNAFGFGGHNAVLVMRHHA
jgi:3-oxoacyl-[acyl-carrier-protein] synthase II